MINKLMERVISIGIILIVLAFNPFVFAGLYMDSTASFSFVATLKIIILAAMNIVLLILWILKVQKTKELTITPTRIYIPIFLFLVSAILSAFLANNRGLSMLGYNVTLENSLVEIVMIFVFAFIVINNLRTKEEVENILRFLNIGLSIAFLYMIVRYMGNWSIEGGSLRDFLNTTTFSLTGHYGSLPVLALVGMLLSIGLLISDIVLIREKINLVIDSVTVVLSTIGFVVFVNLGGNAPEYIYLLTGLLALVTIGYVIYTNTRLQQTLIPVFGLTFLGLILGLGLYFGITTNASQPKSYPSMTINATWNVTLDSIKNPFTRGIVGNGQGNFAYAFDRFKTEDVAYPIKDGDQLRSNFTVNSQSPNVEEIRVYQPSSYFFGTLLSQGLFGIISLMLMFGFTLAIGMKKGIAGSGIIGVFSLMVFLGLMGLSIFFRYDFILVFIMWLILSVFIISSHEDEPQKNLVIAVTGRSYEFSSNLNYIIPALMILGCVLVLLSSYRIVLGNYYASRAKHAQIAGDNTAFQNLSQQAATTLPESDIFIRENILSRTTILFTKYVEAQKIIQADPEKASTNSEVINLANEITQIQNGIIGDINYARGLYPDEYKNYYFAGIILARASEFTDLKFDRDAISFFANSITVNPFHPDTYYHVALIQFRNKDNASALNNIRPAVTYRPQNLLYQATFADILAANSNYTDALSIYNDLKKLKDTNPSNQEYLKFYADQNIDKDIQDAQKKLDEQNAQNKTTPTPTPTPSITATPTPTPSKKN